MCRGGRRVTGLEETPPWTNPLHQLRYGVYGRLLSTCYSWRGSLALHLSFSLRNKKAGPPLSFSAGVGGGRLSSHLPLPPRDPWETLNQPTPPCLLPCQFLPPSPLTSLIFLPLMLKLTITFTPPKIFSSPFCHHPFVFWSPSCLSVPSLVVAQPPSDPYL